MAPQLTKVGTVIVDKSNNDPCTVSEQELEKHNETFKPSWVWKNIFFYAYLHLFAVYGIYLALTSAKLFTVLFSYLLYVIAGLGITAGAHRLWAHKSYKAKLPLRVILMMFNTLAVQNDIYEWSRDHRVHHKFSETNADPHNATRGFFFAHVGWLLQKKHPDVRIQGKKLDFNDLLDDPVIQFQKRYYYVLVLLIAVAFPMLVPWYFWNESLWNALFVPTILRYCITLNMTWLVNSAAHILGNKPYDKFINPGECLGVALGSLGEGWHNYHHTFPWDYKAAELGDYTINFSKAFIDFFAIFGWAYDLKTVSKEQVLKKASKSGDGSHPFHTQITENVITKQE